MERPGLQRLLADIRDKLFDVVVVSKVDRLTRSLADFAKMAGPYHRLTGLRSTDQGRVTRYMTDTPFSPSW